MQIAEFAPETLHAIKAGFASGELYPIYGGAHHAHVTLLTEPELADELRLNQEFVHDVMGAPRPKFRGAFPMEGSIDAHKLAAFREAGIDYVVFPQLSPRKARYRLEPDGDCIHEPFMLDHGLLALPRHFPVSQDIWRPITKWKPEGLKLQGYILGEYPVFDEEYRGHRYVDFPIDYQQCVDEYRAVLERAVAEAPDGGLLLYIQDLELMDYGEEALEILRDALPAVRVDGVNVHIVTPDDYIDRWLKRGRRAPRLYFHQNSWAPEIRPVLRADGHYPPHNAGPYRDYDFEPEVFRRWPFIYWEWGRFHVEIVNRLLESFGYPLVVPLSAGEWWERGYRYEGLTKPERLALLSRVVKQADNWGWQPDDDRQKRPYLYLQAIIEMLLAELPKQSQPLRFGFQPFEQRLLLGLERLLELFIDQRVAYLRQGIERLGQRAGEHVQWAHHHLGRADERRSAATNAIRRASAANERLSEAGAPHDIDAVRALLDALRDHCRDVYLATDEIQRAWGPIGDKLGMVIEMYRYLYDLYPPLFPQLLRDLAPPEELAMVEDPELL
jgi:hypothetical protein